MSGQFLSLSKVFRPGAGRQRLCKGYILEGGPKLVSELLAPQSVVRAHALEHGLTLRGSPHTPHALWLDSGLLLLNHRHTREKLAASVQAMALELSTAALEHGGRLLPSAVRFDGSKPWANFVCSDEHFIETQSEREKSVFCNLMRFHLPELLALTGRAGASRMGVERLGSRRMADSRRHVPARPFESLAPEYLPHLMKSLAREQRVQQTSLLDIDPHVAEEPNDDCVELRFVDAQIQIWTTLAHALVFEALLIRARRIVLEDCELPDYPQARFERDRARAIQHGLKAHFSERSLVDYPRSPLPEERAESTLAPPSAPERVLHLLDDLDFEFRALDARYRDLAPLVLGLKLRQWGNLSLQSENDLLQSTLAVELREDPEQRVRSLLLSKHDPLAARNERFAQARDVRADWIHRLSLPGEQ